MKFSITRYHAVACWQWDTSSEPHKLYRYGKAGAANPNAISAFDDDDDDDDEEVCGICQLAFEACCPECKVPGDDCPLSESPLRIAQSRWLIGQYGANVRIRFTCIAC